MTVDTADLDTSEPVADLERERFRKAIREWHDEFSALEGNATRHAYARDNPHPVDEYWSDRQYVGPYTHQREGWEGDLPEGEFTNPPWNKLHVDIQETGGEWTEHHDRTLEVACRIVSDYENYDPHDPAWPAVTPIPFGEKYRERLDWKLLRQTLGWTVKQLGDHLNVDPTTVGRWENGRRRSETERYYIWLKDAAAHLTWQARQTVYLLVIQRDGWTDETRENLDTLWQHLWAPNGLYTRWQQTGRLPTFTPKYL